MTDAAIDAVAHAVTKADHTALAEELGRERRQRIERRLIVIGTAVVFLSLWEIAGRLSNPLFFAPVSEVIPELFNGLMDPRGALLTASSRRWACSCPGSSSPARSASRSAF